MTKNYYYPESRPISSHRAGMLPDLALLARDLHEEQAGIPWESVSPRIVTGISSRPSASELRFPSPLPVPGATYVDLSEIVVQICPQLLASWKKTADEVRSVGLENLRLRSLHDYWESCAHGVHILDGLDEGYLGSRILLPGWLSSCPHGAIAAVPNLATLMVGPKTPKALRHMLRTAHSIYSRSNHPVSPLLYVEQQGDIVPLDLPLNHSCRNELRRNQRLLATSQAN